MDYYRLCVPDYRQSSWVLHSAVKKLPKRPQSPELPPAFYKFFPSTDARVQIKPEYQGLCCRKCGRYDTDAAFKVGFDEPVAIRLKDDIGFTSDRLFIINAKCLYALEKAKVGGYATSRIGKTAWHAFRITVFVKSVDGLLKPLGPPCPECGRPADMGGIVNFLNEITPPQVPNTFFSTESSSPSLSFKDRDIFFTQEVLKTLKNAKVKGPYCERLWTDDELRRRDEKKKQGVNWLPPLMTVYLSGK